MTVRVNGKEYKAEQAKEWFIYLTGKRGGKKEMVKNINSGNWYIGNERGSSIVTDFEILSK